MKVTAVKNMLLAQEMSRAVTFYQSVFGFGLALASEFWSELTWGDAIIALHGGHDGTRQRTNLSIEVDDINPAASRISEFGGRLVVEPLRREGEPIIYAEFADTEGNVVMLTQFVGDP